MLRSALLALGLAVSVGSAQGQEPAPTHLPAGAKVFIERTDFGMALSAAILKKHVPVSILTDSTKADFYVRTTAASTKEGGAERVAKVLTLGVGAGSGKHFEATVTINNKDGALVFAHNSKKENFQSAAENIANEMKKSIEKQY